MPNVQLERIPRSPKTGLSRTALHGVTGQVGCPLCRWKRVLRAGFTIPQLAPQLVAEGFASVCQSGKSTDLRRIQRSVLGIPRP